MSVVLNTGVKLRKPAFAGRILLAAAGRGCSDGKHDRTHCLGRFITGKIVRAAYKFEI
jgi:hypothetical protein